MGERCGDPTCNCGRWGEPEGTQVNVKVEENMDNYDYRCGDPACPCDPSAVEKRVDRTHQTDADVTPMRPSDEALARGEMARLRQALLYLLARTVEVETGAESVSIFVCTDLSPDESAVIAQELEEYLQ